MGLGIVFVTSARKALAWLLRGVAPALCVHLGSTSFYVGLRTVWPALLGLSSQIWAPRRVYLVPRVPISQRPTAHSVWNVLEGGSRQSQGARFASLVLLVRSNPIWAAPFVSLARRVFSSRTLERLSVFRAARATTVIHQEGLLVRSVVQGGSRPPPVQWRATSADWVLSVPVWGQIVLSCV